MTDRIEREAAIREAYDSLFRHPGFVHSISGQRFMAVKLEDAAEAILALLDAPAPDPFATAAGVLLANLPGEHQAWSDLQDAVDEGKDEDDCIKAFLRALAGGSHE